MVVLYSKKQRVYFYLLHRAPEQPISKRLEATYHHHLHQGKQLLGWQQKSFIVEDKAWRPSNTQNKPQHFLVSFWLAFFEKHVFPSFLGRRPEDSISHLQDLAYYGGSPSSGTKQTNSKSLVGAFKTKTKNILAVNLKGKSPFP